MELALTAGQVTFGQGLLEYLGITPNGTISVTHAPGGHLDIAAAGQKDSTDEMLAQLKALNDAYKGEKIHLTIEEIQKGIEEAYVAHGMRGLE